MNYSAIKYPDIANGNGVRVSLFVSGCTHHCEGCFNPDTWNFNAGQPFTKETENYILDLMKDDFITGLTLLGGEPFEPSNQECLLPFLLKVKSLYPNKSIWSYSGYTYEELTDSNNKRCHTKYTNRILEILDILVDGEFKLPLKDITLRFRGSSNQRIIDLKKTLSSNEIVISDFQNKTNFKPL